MSALPEWTEIRAVREEGPGIRSFFIPFCGWSRVRPGQFVMLYVPGLWEIPISVAGAQEGEILLTVAKVGRVTSSLFKLGPGDRVALRGPFGRSWPLQRFFGSRVLVVAGGIGLAPLRMLIRRLLGPHITVVYGARSPSLLLYREEYSAWRRRGARLLLTVDEPEEGWEGPVGVVTELLTPELVGGHRYAAVVGPPIMMRYALAKLEALGMPAERVYLSLENHMKCGTGHCGHCRIGDFYVCVDGPVVRADALGQLARWAGGVI